MYQIRSDFKISKPYCRLSDHFLSHFHLFYYLNHFHIYFYYICPKIDFSTQS